MHTSVLKLLPCTIHHAVKSIKTMSAIAIKLRIQLGYRYCRTGALFGCSGAPTKGGGVQIIGGAVAEMGSGGLQSNLTPGGHLVLSLHSLNEPS